MHASCTLRPQRAWCFTSKRPAANYHRNRRQLHCAATIVARWAFDVRYGSKMEAVALLQEWCAPSGPGGKAGCSATNTRIHSGSVGVAESRLELEVELPALAELEAFWASIPPAEHQAWSKRLQPLIVHGSPAWEIYRSVEVGGGGGVPARVSSGAGASSSGAAGAGAGGAAPTLAFASDDEVAKYTAGLEPSPPPATEETPSGLAIVSGDEGTAAVLDWKGDPMKVNPKDKLPFKFL